MAKAALALAYREAPSGVFVSRCSRGQSEAEHCFPSAGLKSKQTGFRAGGGPGRAEATTGAPAIGTGGLALAENGREPPAVVPPDAAAVREPDA